MPSFRAGERPNTGPNSRNAHVQTAIVFRLRRLHCLLDPTNSIREDNVKRIALLVALILASTAAHSDLVEDARRQLDRGQHAEALDNLEQHLSIEPADADARFLRGITLVMLERNDEAIQAFADLTRDFPQLPEPYNNLAVLYARMGQYEKARDALEAALATHPSYATAHENLGDIYTALAGAAYNRALVLDKNNQALRVKLNMVSQLSGKPGASPVASDQTVDMPAPVVSTTAPGAQPSASDPTVVTELTGAAYAWADAWSQQNVAAYINAYGPGFRPPRGISRQAWEAQRRNRILAPASISVKVLNPVVALQGPTRARVSFIQIYESDSYADQVRKVLEFELVGGRWLIVSEAVTNR